MPLEAAWILARRAFIFSRGFLGDKIHLINAAYLARIFAAFGAATAKQYGLPGFLSK
jgi:hypothetical protein